MGGPWYEVSLLHIWLSLFPTCRGHGLLLQEVVLELWQCQSQRQMQASWWISMYLLWEMAHAWDPKENVSLCQAVDMVLPLFTGIAKSSSTSAISSDSTGFAWEDNMSWRKCKHLLDCKYGLTFVHRCYFFFNNKRKILRGDTNEWRSSVSSVGHCRRT